MKAVIITLALAGLATAPLDAQILGSRLPTPSTSTSTGVYANGQWQVIGRDGNGNTIYERRTQDRNGNVIVQRARRNSNGSMTIISTNTVGNVNNRNDRNNNCAYAQSTNSVGDIIFGRTNTNVNCDDVGNRVDGGWYQVGRGANNNSIYERRTRDRNGNLVIQRARRNSNGSFTILSTRYANDNDKQWQKAEKRREKELKKEQKEQDKQWKKSHGDNDDNRYNNGDHQYSNNDSRYSNSEQKGKGRGKGQKGRD
jgi:hypothetical protein